MPLSAGKRLGSYEILAIVGVGGMGEVYKARDTRLDRIVAIKVLPEHVASDPDLRSRFEREAKAISSLSHAHICTLHDVGSESGVEFLVMEYLEGETAAQRVAKGPLPIQQVLRYGVEIAEALDRAHRQGITHRDLKPGNVMLTKSGVKLLDFGLAKLKPVEIERGAGSAPTAAADLTGNGAILGTLQYMAPEQVEGKAVDHRVDIFALGAILYELATAKRAFEGASQASLIGAILRDDPHPISELQPLSPPALDALVATCLAKEPDDRWQSAADVGRQLRLMQGSSSSLRARPVVTGRAAPRRTLPLAVGMLLAGALLATAALRLSSRPAPVQPALVSRFTIVPPDAAVLTDIPPLDLAISPDGKRVAYFAATGEKTALYVRDLDRLESRMLTQVPSGSANPVFSQDGESLAFLSGGGGIVRVTIASSLRSKMTEDANYGGAFAADGTFVYANPGALYALPANGGALQTLTPAGTAETANGSAPIYAAPTLLPGGRRVLFTLVTDTEHIAAFDLDSREQRVIIDGAHPHFERSGYLVFARGTTLMAAPFDPERLSVTGAPVAVLPGVRHPSSVAAVDYGLSENGTLVYVPAEPAVVPPRALVWVDRNGRVSGRAIEEPIGGARDPRLSPDGRRLLLAEGSMQDLHLWMHDLGGSPPIPLVTEGINALGVWSPDGSKVAFARSSSGAGLFGIFTIDVDGRNRSPLPVPTGVTIAFPAGWSRAGDLILNSFPSPDIVAYRSADQTVRNIVATSDSEVLPALSPDERWLAYASNRTGRFEIWAMRYPDGTSVPISSGGGTEPRWSRDGSELYFRQGSAMMAVPVDSTGDHPFGAVTKLFDQPFLAAENDVMWSYDVAADHRFLMIESTAPTRAAAGTIVVVQNWGEELKRLMAAH